MRCSIICPARSTCRRSKAKASAKSSRRSCTRKPDPKEPFCGLVFKVLPAKTGDMHWVRVYSGVLKSNSRVLNPGKDMKENVAQLWHIHATKKEEQIDSVEAGDIVGIIGMRHSITGDTICDTREPILLETIKFPETVISMAIEPESSTETEEARRHARHAQAAGPHAAGARAAKRARR